MPNEGIPERCRLCGQAYPLTREHVPPASTYAENSRVMVQDADQYFEGTKGRVYQSGFWTRALCQGCNNNTGSWYGKEFARWSSWGHRFLSAIRESRGGPIEVYEGYPLRVAKQVISTMIAASRPDLTELRPDLCEFVLDRDLRAPEGTIRLSTYLCPTGSGRSTGLVWARNLATGERHDLVEFALPPFGYVLTLGGAPLDPRPVDVSWFTGCKFDEQRRVDLPYLPALPTYEAIPGDYRTKNEIRRDTIENILEEQRHPQPRAEADRIMAAGEGPAFLTGHHERW